MILLTYIITCVSDDFLIMTSREGLTKRHVLFYLILIIFSLLT